MKTVTVIPLLMLAGGLYAASAAAASADPGIQPGTYTIDPGHTYAHFTVDHMGLSQMHGRIDVSQGQIVIAPQRNDSTVNVSLDPASVDTGNDKRDAHLRDMDGFFDVAQYPKMQFTSTAVRFDDDDADEAKVDGRLTLHGVSHPVTLDVDDIQCRINPLDKSRYTCGFSAETTIQRSDYGMNAYPALVGDAIEISIDIEADKPVDSKTG